MRQINIFLLSIVFCCNAYAQQQRYSFTHPQMGTVFKLVFFTDKDSITAAAIANQVFARVDTLNAIFSDYLPESELSRLSDKAGTGEKMKVSKELWEIIGMAHRFAKASDGAFDITVGASTRLWRKARNMKELPDSLPIIAAKSTVGYQQIKRTKGRTVLINSKGTRLDLGGIAQGYAADECLKILKKAGISIALADAGGDIAVGDAPPGTKGWAIARATENSEEILTLANCGITTSGARYRYFEANGIRYSHIVDPRTGWGMTHRNLVTVKAPNAVTADAWATALSVMSEADWLTLRSKHPYLTVWIDTFQLN